MQHSKEKVHFTCLMPCSENRKMSDNNGRDIPEHLRGHCMIGKYEYESVDPDTGEIRYKLINVVVNCAIT